MRPRAPVGPCAGLFKLDTVVKLPRSLYIQIAINSHQQRLRFMFTWRTDQVLFCTGDGQQFATRTDMIRRHVQNDGVCTVDSVVYFGVLSLPHGCLLAIALREAVIFVRSNL